MSKESEKIKVFIVDDHDIFRQGVKMLLSNTGKIEVIEEASNGKEFIEKLNLITPDIVLMDIAMPEMDGIEATRMAKEKKPDLNILALTMFGDEKYYYQLLQYGIKGFVLKSAGISELMNAIEAVAIGNNYFSNELLLKLIHFVKTSNSTNECSLLTKREIEVLELIACGLSNEEIAEKLHISNTTVRTHRSNLLQKTGCKNTASLVMYAIKNNLIQVDINNN